VTEREELLKPARIPPDRPLGGRQYQLKSIPAARNITIIIKIITSNTHGDEP
jgi:hypothetical protein